VLCSLVFSTFSLCPQYDPSTSMAFPLRLYCVPKATQMRLCYVLCVLTATIAFVRRLSCDCTTTILCPCYVYKNNTFYHKFHSSGVWPSTRLYGVLSTSVLRLLRSYCVLTTMLLRLWRLHCDLTRTQQECRVSATVLCMFKIFADGLRPWVPRYDLAASMATVLRPGS